MCDVVFGSAEHHLGLVAAGHASQVAEKFIAIHHRHVPVEQDRVRQSAPAGFQRLFAVLRLDDLKVQPFQDAPCDFSNDARVIHHETCSHLSLCFFHSRKGRSIPTVSAAGLRGYAASNSGTISSTRSTSRMTMS